MEYPYNPNRYHYPPHSPANPNLPPPYPGGRPPYPSHHSTGSFDGYYYPTAAPPTTPSHGHSSSLPYCIPPPSPHHSQLPPPYPSYTPPYASYSHCHLPHPQDHPPSPSSYGSSPLRRDDFHQQQDLRFPPPHSDAFYNAYGRHEDFALATSPTAVSSRPFSPNSSSSSSPFRPTAPHQSSSSPTPSGCTLESLLSDMNINDQHRPPPVSTISAPSPAHSPSPSLDMYSPAMGGLYPFPNHSFSGAPSFQTPPSPSSPWSQQPTHGHSISVGGLPLINLVNGSPSSQSQVVPFQASLRVRLLHGNIDIMVYEARNLPNMDLVAKAFSDVVGWRFAGKITSKLEEHSMSSITSDPYVSFSVSKDVLARTYVIKNSENPVWNQHFYVPVAHYAAEVRFTVKDNDFFGSELIGNVVIPVEQIYAGDRIEGTFPIKGKQCKLETTLKLCIQYIPMERLSMYHLGVGPGPDYIGVPGTYFPLRKGGRVKLYQDAHVPDGSLPDVRIDNGLRYEHGKCWQDIAQAMCDARKLIYIAGWSVYHKVRLVRDSPHGSDSPMTLGDLLKSKSGEGVRVLLLVWDDPTSRTILGYEKDGIMQTHDEETRKFFKHSSVRVLLCPRSAGKRHSWIKQKEVGIIYTHHQKTVIVDSDAGYSKRKIIAFVGGLDLCDGRYDTPKHSLFRTLQTVHKDDYHNPTFVGTDIGGPREPWHDLHCRIDGPAAYDVLKNFEDRWLKASKRRGIKKLKKVEDDALLKLERVPEILSMDESPYLNDYDPETWHVQIFRSIDSNSVKGFPKNPKEATSKSLVCGKNVLIDMSIHTAYVKAIRAAQHFIYIENQYFLGSSYNWDSYKELGANNLIPMEIALKIANKIKSNERFSAYIVIPMWPEGVPTGVATQRILFWQHKTMQMMYETVYKALVEAGLQNTYEPQDYLNFFCLGNREAVDLNSSFGKPGTASSPNQLLAQKNRRFMIYVHSKGMIVDDEYLILGSANINQRSLEGTRDTEIAMGAYQPQHTWARKFSNPHGQIYAYRMSLWAEHTGILEECFTHPESLECMRRVRQLGELNWRQFVAEEVTEMRGHLLKYPVDVSRKGKVNPLRGCETFPDVGGNICGSFTVVQENLTI